MALFILALALCIGPGAVHFGLGLVYCGTGPGYFGLGPVYFCPGPFYFAPGPVHLYVRSFVRTFVRTYVRVYVRSFVRTFVRTYVRLYAPNVSILFQNCPEMELQLNAHRGKTVCENCFRRLMSISENAAWWTAAESILDNESLGWDPKDWRARGVGVGVTDWLDGVGHGPPSKHPWSCDQKRRALSTKQIWSCKLAVYAHTLFQCAHVRTLYRRMQFGSVLIQLLCNFALAQIARLACR
jgi:hypothetical protein